MKNFHVEDLEPGDFIYFKEEMKEICVDIPRISGVFIVISHDHDNNYIFLDRPYLTHAADPNRFGYLPSRQNLNTSAFYYHYVVKLSS
jgi:hypothetical protein